MATKTPRPPRDSADAVRAVAQDLLPARFTRQAFTEMSVDVSEPVPVLHLGLDAILEGAGPQAAVHSGWRHVVHLGGDAVALADVDEVGGGAQVRQLNYGPYVASVEKSLARSRRSLEKLGGEVRLVQVPALYVLALWHDRSDGGDVVVLDPAPAPFEPGTAYDVEEFVAMLREAARAVGPDGSALPEPADGTDDDRPDDEPKGKRRRPGRA